MLLDDSSLEYLRADAERAVHDGVTEHEFLSSWLAAADDWGRAHSLGRPKHMVLKHQIRDACIMMCIPQLFAEHGLSEDATMNWAYAHGYEYERKCRRRGRKKKTK